MVPAGTADRRTARRRARAPESRRTAGVVVAEWAAAARRARRTSPGRAGPTAALDSVVPLPDSTAGPDSTVAARPTAAGRLPTADSDPPARQPDSNRATVRPGCAVGSGRPGRVAMAGLPADSFPAMVWRGCVAGSDRPAGHLRDSPWADAAAWGPPAGRHGPVVQRATTRPVAGRATTAWRQADRAADPTPPSSGQAAARYRRAATRPSGRARPDSAVPRRNRPADAAMGRRAGSARRIRRTWSGRCAGRRIHCSRSSPID